MRHNSFFEQQNHMLRIIAGLEQYPSQINGRFKQTLQYYLSTFIGKYVYESFVYILGDDDLRIQETDNTTSRPQPTNPSPAY